MTSFFWIILAVAVYGALHSLTASMHIKALAENWLGLFARRFYRLVYNLFALIGWLAVMGLAARLPDQRLYQISMPWLILSLGVQLVWGACALLALHQTGLGALSGLEQLLTPDGNPKPRPLSLGGFYRWMRHPVYTFSLLFIWSSPVMTLNLLALYLGVTLYILVGIYFEERKLIGEFGDVYAEYRRRTPMLFPPFF